MFFEKEMSEIRWVFLKFLYVSQRSLQVIGQIEPADVNWRGLFVINFNPIFKFVVFVLINRIVCRQEFVDH